MFHVPEQHRITEGFMAGTAEWGNNGTFRIPNAIPHDSLTHSVLWVIASDGGDWEHVSVSLPSRCPTWDEMNYIKSLYWDDEDAVMQLHPPRSQYINNHSFCLHMWRPLTQQIPLPPDWMVGFKPLDEVEARVQAQSSKSSAGSR